MITIHLTLEQLEAAETAIAIFTERLAMERCESTYSEITNNRHKTILEVWKILKEARTR